MIVLCTALFAAWAREESRIGDARQTALQACDRGNGIRRQIRLQNTILQDVLAGISTGGAPYQSVLDNALVRLRGQYTSKDLTSIACSTVIR